MRRTFTGRHMAAIIVSFFGVVIAVNLTMAHLALSTFGGIVVENTYVASQEFNGWLEDERRQRALGWDAITTWRPDNRLSVRLLGVPGAARVAATARHPLGRVPDRSLAFEPTGGGRFESTSALPEGRWIVRLEVTAAGEQWRREEEIR